MMNGTIIAILSILLTTAFGSSMDLDSGVDLVECQKSNEFLVASSTAFIRLYRQKKSNANSSEIESSVTCLISQIEGYPLPEWLTTIATIRKDACVVIGNTPSVTSESDTSSMFRLTIMNDDSYDVTCYEEKLALIPKEMAFNQVTLHIINVDAGEMSSTQRSDSLLSIFQKHLWEGSRDLYISHYQIPDESLLSQSINPGVTVQLSSQAQFSERMLSLRTEVESFKSRCDEIARFPKRTSVERLFLQYNFRIDWCKFEMNVMGVPEVTVTEPERRVTHLSDEAFNVALASDVQSIPISTKEELQELNDRFFKIVIVISVALALLLLVAMMMAIFEIPSTLFAPDEYSEDYFQSIFYICEDHYAKTRRSKKHKVDDV